MTYLCVAIFVETEQQAQRDIALAAEAGADMVELRVDAHADVDQVGTVLIQRIVRDAPLPTIVTARPTWEGGRSVDTDDARLSKLVAAVQAATTYVDVELATYVRNEASIQEVNQGIAPTAEPRQTRSGLILSSHDFTGRPAKLTSIYDELVRSPADVAKIVWTARAIRDNLEAFELLRHRAKPTIALCMGEAGLISRVLAKKFGAFLTFASLEAGGGTAPGQVSITDMKRLYRWDAITPATKVYGVVGSPVAHSMSPAIHNASFDATGFDGVYVPLLVEASYESFKAFMETFLAAEELDLSGLSITIPHKENALRYLKEKGAEIDPLAERIGAVNTIAIRKARLGGGGSDNNAQCEHEIDPSVAVASAKADATLFGTSTDYAAILDSITTKLGIDREQLKDYRVAVIGAGGTGRTAVAALAHYGATVVVYNRTREKADSLAAEFNGKTGKVVAADMAKLCDSCCQIYINTTSIGMSPNVAQSAFGDQPPALSAVSLVFDAVYNPVRTILLRQAEASGAKTINGVEMFVRQAAAQFELWTGIPAPTDVMRDVVESRL